MIKTIKRAVVIFVALITMISSVCVVAETEDIIDVMPDTESSSTNPVRVLFLGNSLFYYNNMHTQMFPQLCTSLGKSVEVDSVTAAHTTLYRLCSDKTQEGQRALEKLQQNTYDYVILQPSRRVSPYEYSIYHAEYKAALKLNNIICETGAKTLLIASPGVNTGEIEVCSLSSDGVSSKIIEYLPIERETHKKFFENLCMDLVKEMKNAEVVRVGEAHEMLIKNIPDYKSLYKSDNRHPSQRGSYVQAACIYSSIFGESTVGAGYTEDLTPYNAVLAQRASDIAILGENKSVLFNETQNLNLNCELLSNDIACVYLNSPQNALSFDVYRKTNNEAFVQISSIYENESYCVDYDLEPGADYTYKVKGYYSVGDLSYQVEQSCPSVLHTFEQPEKPNLVLVDKSTIKLKITPVLTADDYQIYRRKRGVGGYEYIGTTKKLSYIDKNLESGFLYDYRIVAQKQEGLIVSEHSKKSTLFASASPRVTVESTKKRTAKITVTRVTGADLYVIYYKKHSESKYKLLTKTSRLKTKIKGLESGVYYDFRIKACVGKNIASCSSPYTEKTRKIR